MPPKSPSYWKPYITQSSYAAGTSLDMTLVGYSNSAAIAIIIGVLLLTVIAYLSKPYLEDLV